MPSLWCMIMTWLFVRNLARYSTVLLSVALIVACGKRSSALVESRPAEVAGRWVRQLDNGDWRDTIDFRPDGTVGDSIGSPVPTSARWSVQTRNGMRVFCAGDSVESSCQSYHTADNILTLGGISSPATRYRRVPQDRQYPRTGARLSHNILTCT